jgi:hypothetical protein
MGDQNNNQTTDPNAPVTMPGQQPMQPQTPAPTTGGDQGNTGWPTPTPAPTGDTGTGMPEPTPVATPEPTAPVTPEAPVGQNPAPVEPGTWPAQPTTDGQTSGDAGGTGTTGI